MHERMHERISVSCNSGTDDGSGATEATQHRRQCVRSSERLLHKLMKMSAFLLQRHQTRASQQPVSHVAPHRICINTSGALVRLAFCRDDNRKYRVRPAHHHHTIRAHTASASPLCWCHTRRHTLTRALRKTDTHTRARALAQTNRSFPVLRSLLTLSSLSH